MDALLRDPCCLLGLGVVAIGGMAWLGFAVADLIRDRMQRARMAASDSTRETR